MVSTSTRNGCGSNTTTMHFMHVKHFELLSRPDARKKIPYNNTYTLTHTSTHAHAQPQGRAANAHTHFLWWQAA